MTPVLQTPSLWLEPMRDSDEALFVALYTDPDTMRHMGLVMDVASATTAFRAAWRQTEAAGGSQRFWTLREKQTDKRIGVMGLTLLAGDDSEVGILIDATRRGHGHAAYCLAALADHVFEDLHRRRFGARHTSTNASTAALLRKLGFTCLTSDPSIDIQRWEMLPCDWPMLRARWRPAGLQSGRPVAADR